MTLRTALAATLAAAIAAVGGANAATIVLDSANLHPASVLSGSIGDVAVSASAATWTHGSLQGTGVIDRLGAHDRATIQTWSGHGLGVINDPHGDSDHRIDGLGTLDLVILEFGRDVTLTGLGFSYVDAWDDFVLFSGDSLADLTTFTLRDVASGTVCLDITARFFGIGAADWNDSFKLTAIDFDVAPVPVPAAAALLLTGLGVGGFARAKRRA